MDLRKASIMLKGLAISPGLAMGAAFVYRDILRRGIERYSISEAEAGEEWARIENAVNAVSEDLKRTADKVDKRVDNDGSKIWLYPDFPTELFLN